MSVRVDAKAALAMIERVEAAVADERGRSLRFGAELMMRDTARAFAAGVSPRTSRQWPSRKHSYPWPMLRRTGRLQSLLTTGYGRRAGKTKTPRLFGKVRDGMYGREPNIVIAGAVHFGRSKARSAKGTKLFGQAPSTGTVPPREIFGMGIGNRRKFARYWEKQIAKAAS